MNSVYVVDTSRSDGNHKPPAPEKKPLSKAEFILRTTISPSLFSSLFEMFPEKHRNFNSSADFLCLVIRKSWELAGTNVIMRKVIDRHSEEALRIEKLLAGDNSICPVVLIHRCLLLHQASQP